MTSSNSPSLHNRFIAETNAFLNWKLTNRNAQQRKSTYRRRQVGTLITVLGCVDGGIDNEAGRVLRRQLEMVLACRDTDVLIDLDGVRLPDKKLEEIVSEFQTKFASDGRHLVVLDA